jgi:hypothetical protein
MHELFKNAVTTAKGLDRKGTSMWEDLVNFSVTVEGDRKALDASFKKQEREAVIEVKYEMDKNSTYRAIKSVIGKARELDVLLIIDGKVRGKTEVEKECKAKAEETAKPKSELDKFKSTMNTANAIADKLEAKDAVMAAALVQDLLAKLVEMCKPSLAATGTNG